MLHTFSSLSGVAQLTQPQPVRQLCCNNGIVAGAGRVDPVRRCPHWLLQRGVVEALAQKRTTRS